MTKRGNSGWHRAALALVIAAAVAGMACAAVTELGDDGDASTALLALVDREPLALLLDEERDVCHADTHTSTHNTFPFFSHAHR